MPSDHLYAQVAAVAGTYLLHSTLWVALLALGLRVGRSSSPALRSRVWLAALWLPMLTTLGVALRGESGWVLRWGEAGAAAPLAPTSVSVAMPVATRSFDPVDLEMEPSGEAHSPGTLNSDESAVDLTLVTGASELPVSPTLTVEPAAIDVNSASGDEEPWVVEINPAPATAEENDAPVAALSAEDVPWVVAEQSPPVGWTETGSGEQLPMQRGLAVVGIVVFPSAIVGLTLFVWRLYAARRWLLAAQPVLAGPVSALLQRLLQEWGVSQSIQLLSHPRCREPAACGVWRRAIVLPVNLDEQISRDELRALLAHELAHHVRRDPLWLCLGQLVTHLAWWQPLNGWALRQWRRNAELLCDQWTLGRGVNAITLAKCLANIAELRLAHAVSPGLTAGGASLSLRIEQLLSTGRVIDAWEFPLRRRLLTIVLLSLLAAAAWMGPSLRWRGLELQSTPTRDGIDPGQNDLAIAAPITPVTEPPNDRIGDNAEIARQIAGVTEDLDRALRLLSAVESDAEVDVLVAQLQRRLVRLRESSTREDREAIRADDSLQSHEDTEDSMESGSRMDVGKANDGQRP